LSDEALPNNEAAEEHFDGSQIRVENRQFRALLTPACLRRDSPSDGLPSIGNSTIKPSRSRCHDNDDDCLAGGSSSLSSARMVCLSLA
jgi:hypothetical protein